LYYYIKDDLNKEILLTSCMYYVGLALAAKIQCVKEF